MERIILKVLPYIASIGAGILFFLIGLELEDYLRGLFTGISAAFIAIPLIYLFYQRVYYMSQRSLNREIFDYAKMQIDRVLLSIINQLQTVVYPLEEKEFTQKGVSKFLSLERQDIQQVISNNEYLGFQIFKKWEADESSLHETLKNSFILKGLESDQIISIILIVRSLSHLDSIQKGEAVYRSTTKKSTSYKVVVGKELNQANIKFPDRYLLLTDLGDNKYVVTDFGDFYLYDIDKLLQIYTLNEKYLDIFSNAVFDLMTQIKKWVVLTGGEFVIDVRMFRLSNRVTLDT